MLPVHENLKINFFGLVCGFKPACELTEDMLQNFYFLLTDFHGNTV